ncbi:hypothetical protein JAB8_06020 [Janthinobacterium sp. HH106]|uniref:hypothetical protein n=1 Tax=Janthinobacterium sp. HH106 TaxID=1537278 RepID=UPI0008735D11|nr:hypothetical protein [Janthinobacterium sp. HH106]OEZ93486.1 hypothetical protein JAB8_06020 [Janthinobacterium sp. HH106]
MATAKKNLGKMPCPDCGDPVAVMQSEPGTLSYKCQHADCESSGFAQAHTGAARRWLAKLPKPALGEPPKAEVKPPVKEAEKQQPKGGFSFLNA